MKLAALLANLAVISLFEEITHRRSIGSIADVAVDS